MQDCKASSGDYGKVAAKYIEISNKNSKELQETCTSGDVACAGWQELIKSAANVAHPSQVRLDEKLKDPTAAALVNYLNGTDLKFPEDNITTGEVKLSDVIGSAIIGGITAGEDYNSTIAWNAADGYYQTEISGDDPFIAALLSQAVASAGYGAGNVLKVPFDKKLNPISKQYEWLPTGFWTITKPVPQNPLPSIIGNIGDTTVSGMVQDKLKENGGK